jgi:hypothetical protein
MDAILNSEQREHYRDHGWLLVTGVLELSVDQLQREVDAISAWDESGEWMHHYEMTDYGRKLARTENFTPYSSPMHQLLRGGVVGQIAGELLGEDALLYKEKINYKLVGGAGFSPHQDKPAYPLVDNVLSVMIAVDDATIENGCLYVVSDWHHELLAQDERGCLSEEIIATLDWQPMPLAAGDTLFFHALTPHCSGPNTSSRDRRALYPTYNGASEGDLREDYYLSKLEAFELPDTGDRVRLSLIGDFEGRPA